MDCSLRAEMLQDSGVPRGLPCPSRFNYEVSGHFRQRKCIRERLAALGMQAAAHRRKEHLNLRQMHSRRRFYTQTRNYIASLSAETELKLF